MSMNTGSREETVTVGSPTLLADGWPRMQYNPKKLLLKASVNNTDSVLVDTAQNGNFAFKLEPGEAIGWNVHGSDELWGKAAAGVQTVEILESL